MGVRALAIPAAIALLTAARLSAEDLPRGQVIEKVEAAGFPGQSYALYIPSTYTPDKPWPILYALDPLARGKLPVERFAAAAEKHGFLVAGSNNSRNGPLDIARAAIEAMYTDTHTRFSIDDKRLYAAGFSGGARVALAWARNGVIAGAVVCGAAFGSADFPEKVPPRVYIAAGVDDFNYFEMYSASRELAKRGVPHIFAEYPGGHEWLPESLAAEALSFFSGEAQARPAPESKQAKKVFDKFQELIPLLAPSNSTREDLYEKLKKQSEEKEDTPDRRVARQVLEGAFISAVEQGRLLLEQKRYPNAIAAWSTAALVRPDHPMAWYQLARAHAAANNTLSALNAFEKAIENGFRDAADAENDPLLSTLRRFLRFQVLLDRLR